MACEERTVSSTNRLGWSDAWFAALVAVTTAIAYANVLDAGFVWDDQTYVIENETLRDAEGLRRIWLDPRANSQYYPAVFTTFWVEYQLWRLEPLGYHVVNVLLHAANAILLGVLLRWLAVPGSWIAALLFALHPIQVESVAWVSERKNVLSGLFYLASAFAYLRFRGLGATPAPRSGHGYALALGLFAIALLSKSVTASLPAAILLVLYWRNGSVRSRDVVWLLPFFALGVVAGLHTAWLERIHVGAAGAEWDLSFVERSLIASRALVHYAKTLVWPHPLVFSYPRWEIDAGEALQWVYVLAVLAVLAVAFFRRDRGPLVATLFFVGTLFPALGFLDVYPMRFSFVADHFAYLACIGPLALAAAALARVARPARIAVATAWIAALAAVTFAQVGVYRDEGTLWTDTLKENPESFLAHNNLGRFYGLQGDHARAVPHFERAVEILPSDYIAETNLAEALNRLGRYDEAIAHLRNVIAIEPRWGDAHFFLWVALHQTGRMDEAVRHLRREAELKNTFEAHLDASRRLRGAGRPSDALREIALAEQIAPGDPTAALVAGNLHADLGAWERAAAAFREALRRRPGWALAHANLGRALAALGLREAAEREYDRALAIDPGNARARGLLEELRAGADPGPGAPPR